jgi:hypothetical protein
VNGESIARCRGEALAREAVAQAKGAEVQRLRRRFGLNGFKLHGGRLELACQLAELGGLGAEGGDDGAGHLLATITHGRRRIAVHFLTADRGGRFRVRSSAASGLRPHALVGGTRFPF